MNNINPSMFYGFLLGVFFALIFISISKNNER